MSINKPLVSVCMITYNQAEYIHQALKSVLDQICKFEFEVILSNDASNDNSERIIRDLIISHPNGFRVKYFNQPVNLGMNPNLAFAYKYCEGKYIAVCEGDDYWTDPLKLQKQVDFLEANPEFVLCYHPVDVLFPDGKKVVDFIIKDIIDVSESTVYDLAVLGNYIHTPSVIFKNELNQLPENFYKSPFGDFFLWILIAQHGKIKKLSEVMAVYRYGVGILSSNSCDVNYLKFLNTLEFLADSVEDKTVKEILKNRVISHKISKLPYAVRSLDDFSICTKPEIVSNYITFFNLFKSMIIKVCRKFV